MSNDIWTATAQRAAAEAKWLRPLAITLFVIGLVMTLKGMAVTGDACTEDLLTDGRRFSFACALRELGVKLIYAGPAIALLWALWDAQTYLKRLENGEVFAPATMKLFGRIGDCLITAAVFIAVVTPTLIGWVSEGRGFEVNLEPLPLTLFGLGVVLTAIARVFGDVLAAAEAVKADSDAIL